MDDAGHIADKIVGNLNLLRLAATPVAVLRRCVHRFTDPHRWDELVYNFGRQLRNLGEGTHQTQETLNARRLRGRIIYEAFQLGCSCPSSPSARLISGKHRPKSFITDFTLHIVFIQLADDAVERSNASFRFGKLILAFCKPRSFSRVDAAVSFSVNFRSSVFANRMTR